MYNFMLLFPNEIEKIFEFIIAEQSVINDEIF